jgi:GNAT superfamily N-acetyltransferase
MGNDAFSIRPYSSVTDDQNLREMCKDVWGGTDYLPETASSYENDPACQFLVLEDQASGSLAAAGNLRAIDPSKGISYWIEAIRVSPSFEGRGVGTGLVRELCKRARDKGALEILSSTIDANRAMQAIFGKPEIDLVPVSGFRCPDWDKLENLHGWNTSDEKEPQNLLEVLGAKDLSSNDAKFSRTWDVIETYAELRAVLKRMNRSGSTIGHLPSIANPVFVSDDLRDSLRRGLVRKLRNADEPDDDSKPCVFGIFRDRSMSPGLKSQYVCSIVATSREDFEAAVWEACQPKYLPLLGGVPFGLFTFEQPHPPVPFEADSIQGMLRSVCTDMVFIYYQWVAEGDS